ncbi:hypothetical protein LCGC14_2992560, partial [marine sediment metagenome]
WLGRRVVILDGDEMRETISLGAGFSQEEREIHNLRVARLAQSMATQGFLVIVSVIAPFASTRAKIQEICTPQWVYMKKERTQSEEIYPYEVPTDPILTLDTDELSSEETFHKFSEWLSRV